MKIRKTGRTTEGITGDVTEQEQMWQEIYKYPKIALWVEGPDWRSQGHEDSSMLQCILISCKYSVRSRFSCCAWRYFVLAIFIASILLCKLATIMDFSMKCAWTSPCAVIVSKNVSFNVSEGKLSAASSWDKPVSLDSTTETPSTVEISKCNALRLINLCLVDSAISSGKKTRAERSKACCYGTLEGLSPAVSDYYSSIENDDPNTSN